MSTTPNDFRTKDLPSASFLVAIGKELKGIERENNKCWFIFENKSLCEKLVNDFYFGKSYSQMKSFYEAMQDLKNQIFS